MSARTKYMLIGAIVALAAVKFGGNVPGLSQLRAQVL